MLLTMSVWMLILSGVTALGYQLAYPTITSGCATYFGVSSPLMAYGLMQLTNS